MLAIHTLFNGIEPMLLVGVCFPKIDLEKGRSEYRGALPKVLASFGIAPSDVKHTVDVEQEAGQEKGRHGKKKKGEGGKGSSNTTTAGAQEVGRLYASGKRLPKPERNLAMAHAPRSGKDVFCWNRHRHGGCSKEDKCGRRHDAMSKKNLHWAVAAELTRRGGRRSRSARILPENFDGVVAQLRDTNQRIRGEQPLVATNSWWQKTAGSLNIAEKTRIAEPGPVSGWKVAKRMLDWAKANQVPIAKDGVAAWNDAERKDSTTDTPQDKTNAWCDVEAASP